MLLLEIAIKIYMSHEIKLSEFLDDFFFSLNFVFIFIKIQQNFQQNFSPSKENFGISCNIQIKIIAASVAIEASPRVSQAKKK